MTKMIAYTPVEVPLGKLVLHPANVRARNRTAYTEASVAALAANIRKVGLLQPLLVQKRDKGYGVLAGGRRLAALTLLAADRKVKGFTRKIPIACHPVPEDAPARSARSLSLSENEMVASHERDQPLRGVCGVAECRWSGHS